MEFHSSKMILPTNRSQIQAQSVYAVFDDVTIADFVLPALPYSINPNVALRLGDNNRLRERRSKLLDALGVAE